MTETRRIKARFARVGCYRARIVQIMSVGVFVIGLGTTAQAGENMPAKSSKPPLIVELFTSQGCSSCPPADRLAADLANRDNILLFSLPIDYWDHLGWKDTLASPTFSRRQRNYARHKGHRQVYTPQMVINGRDHVVGSRKGRVEKMLKTQEVDPDTLVPISWTKTENNILTLSFGNAPDHLPQSIEATAWILSYVKKRIVEVRAGENRGRTLTYTNVVRHIAPVGHWRGRKTNLTVPVSALHLGDYDGLAVFLQNKGHGPILGAVQIPK